MNNAPRVPELVQKYLEQACSEPELAELQCVLNADPAAAETFAEATRLHASLTAVFREERGVRETSARITAIGKAHSGALAAAGSHGKSRNYWKWWIAAAALVTLSLATALAMRNRAEPRLLSGSVLVDGQATRRLRQGARITVAGNEPALVRLADGSQVELAKQSEATLFGSTDGYRQLVALHSGQGSFKVQKVSGEFAVNTPLGKVTVLGTEFDVELRPGPQEGEDAMNGKVMLALAVAVAVGSVRVELDGRSLVLSAGESRVFAEQKDQPKDTVGEQPQIAGEQDLKHAEFLAAEGDPQGAVTLMFKILRQATDKDLRSDAREHLVNMGLSSQEILQLDPAALKPEDWDKLLTRLSAQEAQQRRRESDLEYSENLLRAAVSVRVQQDGSVKADVQSKDLARALELVLQVALEGNGGEGAREAQSRLEELGIAGPQVEATRKTILEGNIPPAVQNEIICGICIRLLEKYRGWMEDREEQEDQVFRKRQALRMGTVVYKYLASQHAQTAIFKHSSELLDFWRDMSASRIPEAEKKVNTAPEQPRLTGDKLKREHAPAPTPPPVSNDKEKNE